MTPEIDQSDADNIHVVKTNSVLITKGNISRYTGETTLVDDTLIGVGNTIGVAHECVSPKIEELDPTKIEVEDVSDDDSNEKEPRGSFINSEGLRRSNRNQHHPT